MLKTVIAIENNEIVLYMDYKTRAYFAPFRVFGEEKEGVFRKEYDKVLTQDEALEEVLNWATFEFIILSLSLKLTGMPIPPDQIYDRLDENFAFKIMIYGAVHDYVLNYESQRFAEVKGETVQTIMLRECIKDICAGIDFKKIKNLVKEDLSLEGLSL